MCQQQIELRVKNGKTNTKIPRKEDKCDGRVQGKRDEQALAFDERVRRYEWS